MAVGNPDWMAVDHPDWAVPGKLSGKIEWVNPLDFNGAPADARTVRWDVHWGTETINLNPSRLTRIHHRLREAWAVLVGAKRAYTDAEISDMLEDF